MTGALFTEVLKLVPLYEQARSNDDFDRLVNGSCHLGAVAVTTAVVVDAAFAVIVAVVVVIVVDVVSVVVVVIVFVVVAVVAVAAIVVVVYCYGCGRSCFCWLPSAKTQF